MFNNLRLVDFLHFGGEMLSKIVVETSYKYSGKDEKYVTTHEIPEGDFQLTIRKNEHVITIDMLLMSEDNIFCARSKYIAMILASKYSEELLSEIKDIMNRIKYDYYDNKYALTLIIDNTGEAPIFKLVKS